VKPEDRLGIFVVPHGTDRCWKDTLMTLGSGTDAVVFRAVANPALTSHAARVCVCELHVAPFVVAERMSCAA